MSAFGAKRTLQLQADVAAIADPAGHQFAKLPWRFVQLAGMWPRTRKQLAPG